MGSLTNDELISLLYKIIDTELEKTDDEADEDLIAECSDFIEELNSDSPTFSDAEIDQKLQALYAKAKAEKAKSLTLKESSQNAVSSPRWITKRKLKWIGITAAALVTISTITVAATTDFFSKAWNYVTTNVQKIVGMKPGEKMDESGITIIKNSGAQNYKSIEELLKQEKIEILYPSVLPGKIQLKKIIQNYETKDTYTLEFIFNIDELNIMVSNYYENSLDLWTDPTIYETSVMNFYIKELPDSLYQAIGQYKGYEYCITYNNYNDLIYILDNLKGIEK